MVTEEERSARESAEEQAAPSKRREPMQRTRRGVGGRGSCSRSRARNNEQRTGNRLHGMQSSQRGGGGEARAVRDRQAGRLVEPESMLTQKERAHPVRNRNKHADVVTARMPAKRNDRARKRRRIDVYTSAGKANKYRKGRSHALVERSQFLQRVQSPGLHQTTRGRARE